VSEIQDTTRTTTVGREMPSREEMREGGGGDVLSQIDLAIKSMMSSSLSSKRNMIGLIGCGASDSVDLANDMVPMERTLTSNVDSLWVRTRCHVIAPAAEHVSK
jgi:hypothetical protein